MSELRHSEIKTIKTRILNLYAEESPSIYLELLRYYTYLFRHIALPKEYIKRQQLITNVLTKLGYTAISREEMENLKQTIKLVELCEHKARADKEDNFNTEIVKKFVINVLDVVLRYIEDAKPGFTEAFSIDLALVVNDDRYLEEYEHILMEDQDKAETESTYDKVTKDKDLKNVPRLLDKLYKDAIDEDYYDSYKDSGVTKVRNNVLSDEEVENYELPEDFILNCKKLIKQFDYVTCEKICKAELQKKVKLPYEVMYLYFVSKYRCVFNEGTVLSCDTTLDAKRDDEWRVTLNKYNVQQLRTLHNELIEFQEHIKKNKEQENDNIFLLYDDEQIELPENKRIKQSINQYRKKMKKFSLKEYNSETFNYSERLLSLNSKRMVVFTTKVMSDEVMKLYFSKVNLEARVLVAHNGDIPLVFQKLFETIENFNLAEGDNTLNRLVTETTAKDYRFK